jgi:signal transduction histidine kinase
MIYFSLKDFHMDYRILSLVHIVFAGVIASASYNLGLSTRDFYIFSIIILTAPILFYLLNLKEAFNSLYILTMLIIFFVFTALQRTDYSKQWTKILTQQKEMETLINSFPAGIALIKNKKYIYVNENAARAAGLDQSEFIKREVGFLDSNDDFSFHFRQFSDSNLSSATEEITVKSKNENRLNLLILKKLEEDDDLIIAITLDIHDQRQNEVALQSASKMAALGEMSSGLAHEINNPLAVISGQAGQLLRLLDGDSQTKVTTQAIIDGLERIYKTSFRIAAIIKGLRQIARNDSADPKEIVRLDDILNDTLSLCETRIKNKGIDLQKDIQAAEVKISCHEAQIGQVLLNLLNNSFDAIDAISNKWIKIVLLQKNSQTVMIEITDCGNGIPINIQKKIMNPFFTTKPTGKGTGLGLSISKSIIEQHGGSLYYNQESTNTSFIIELPIVQDNLLT